MKSSIAVDPNGEIGECGSGNRDQLRKLTKRLMVFWKVLEFLIDRTR
jgi:hypothetical protein